MMASRVVLPALFGTTGFLTCLLLQKLLHLRHEGLEDEEGNLITKPNPLPGHSSSLQENLCDKADILHDLLSG